MPNTQPPITTAKMAADYKAQLEAIDPLITYRAGPARAAKTTPARYHSSMHSEGSDSGVDAHPCAALR